MRAPVRAENCFRPRSCIALCRGFPRYPGVMETRPWAKLRIVRNHRPAELKLAKRCPVSALRGASIFAREVTTPGGVRYYLDLLDGVVGVATQG